MPIIQLAVPETTESVTRPVTLDIIRSIMSLTEISSKTNVAFYGDMERSKQLNSAIQSMRDDPNKFAHNDKITIEVSEVYEPDRVTNDVPVGPENLAIFNDPLINVVLKPAYAYMTTTVTVKYRANNHNAAQQWHQRMKARISQRRSINIHTVAYHYGIPEELLVVLQEIHRLRENEAGYGEDFDTWFANHRHPKITLLTNQSGVAKLWAMPESQTGIQGWFEFDLPDPPSREGNGDAVTTSFSYKFGYSRPEEVVMIYPIVVHNQVIGEKWRQTPLEDHTDIQKYYSLQGAALAPFEADRSYESRAREYGFMMPTWDEFMPAHVPLKTRRLLTILFTLDTTGPNPDLWVNLADLDTRQFDSDVLAYMRSENNFMTRHGESVLHVNLYRNDLPIGPAPFNITPTLDIVATTDPQPRVSHHIRVGLLTDWTLLSQAAIKRLQEHGRAAILFLQALDPTLEERGLLPVLIGDNYISRGDLQTAIGASRPANNIVSEASYMRTVQIFDLEAHRLK